MTACLVFLVCMLGDYIFCGVPGVSSIMVTRRLFIFTALFCFVFLLPMLAVLGIRKGGPSGYLLPVVMAGGFVFLFFKILFLGSVGLPFGTAKLFALFVTFMGLILIV